MFDNFPADVVIPPEAEARGPAWTRGAALTFGKFGIWFLPTIRAVTEEDVGVGIELLPTFEVGGVRSLELVERVEAIKGHEDDLVSQLELPRWLLQRNYRLDDAQVARLLIGGFTTPAEMKAAYDLVARATLVEPFEAVSRLTDRIRETRARVGLN